ncbi:hypothetical protein [Methylobacterium sp. 88A]|uniref:hypothetical protein n=1 Tax=Methylobacterium sp. 88A TaxID=1131813 RepID=UPI0012F64945|nr:hypothetical protein [Methylobacterium sp. 88A]
MNDEARQLRIDAARKSRGILDSFERVENADHRTGVVHDRVVEAIEAICIKHKTAGKNCFSKEQIECLQELSFHIAYILDPNNKISSSFFGRVKDELKAATVLGRLGFVALCVSVLAGVLTIINVGGNGAVWAYNTATSKHVDNKDVTNSPAAPKVMPPSLMGTAPPK